MEEICQREWSRNKDELMEKIGMGAMETLDLSSVSSTAAFQRLASTVRVHNLSHMIPGQIYR